MDFTSATPLTSIWTIPNFSLAEDLRR
jgi:hypothetical protein